MNRREFGKQVVAGLGGALFAHGAAGATAARAEAAGARSAVTGASARPNVLFIAADDLRASVGCFGDPVAKTPNLDQLGARGVVFNRAYCQQPICNPSRASLMTGRRPDTLRVWDLATHFREGQPDIVTLPQWFKQHGYFTQNIGKVYHGGQTKIQGDPVSWSVPATLHWGALQEPQVTGGVLPPNLATIHDTAMLDVPDEAYVDGRLAADGIKALQALKARDEPFFLALGFRKPHRPFNAPKRYWDMYQPADVPPPAFPAAPLNAPAMAVVSQYKDIVAEVNRSADSVQIYRRGYYAMISYMDAQVGKVINELDRLGLSENTIIVFWADHGFHAGEHGMWGKTSCFELDARVPLIIVSPKGLRRGVRSSAIVELLDIYPTLVELAQLPPVGGLEGKSLVPIINDPSRSGNLAAFSQHPRPWGMRNRDSAALDADAMGYSVRTDDWRYTEWRAWRSGDVFVQELYDERLDPNETRNCIDDPACVDAVRHCKALLVARFGSGAPGVKTPAADSPATSPAGGNSGRLRPALPAAEPTPR